MARAGKSIQDTTFLTAALEGLELQKKRIDEQIRRVKALLGKRTARPVAAVAPSTEKPGRRKLSSAARKRIAEAQKRRWAEYRKAAGNKGK
jgi:hypothetical protein